MVTEVILQIDAKVEKILFGMLDTYVDKIERNFIVSLVNRNGDLKLIGNVENIKRAKSVIDSLVDIIKSGGEVNEQKVDYAITLAQEDDVTKLIELDDSIICRTVQGKPIQPKTIGQKKYVESIEKNMITFGIGPAGTGKSYLAIAKAVTYFKSDKVGRIILTRPAIEAGEKLGFLPGDLQQKVDPYLRPLYDALFQILGPESFHANMEKGLIEVAPLAYMRGRTLDNAFIILDEAQNTTPSQMKMFLTRIGFGSKVIVTGDLTQKDIDQNQQSGLDVAMKILKKVEDIEFCTLTAADVVRHSVVQKIVKAYDEYEQKVKSKNKKVRIGRDKS